MILEKDYVAEIDIEKEGHNCGECQPLIKGERIYKGCLEGCRPDSSKRGGDAFHMEGCPRVGSWGGTVHCE